MNRNDRDTRKTHDIFDLDALLHPARAFEHPSKVVCDPDLTLYEKRAILASWASDACAVEAAPALRQIPGSSQPVRFDDVMDALHALDRQARAAQGGTGKGRTWIKFGDIRDRLARRNRDDGANSGSLQSIN